MVLFNLFFNRNAKVPSIGKIENEIENSEDVTGPNHINSSCSIPVSVACFKHATLTGMYSDNVQ